MISFGGNRNVPILTPGQREAGEALAAKLKRQPVGATPVVVEIAGLPKLVKEASAKLASAQTAAEVLEARDDASTVYDAAKRAARIAKAKGAHDALIAAAHRAQADALEIEAAAKRRLADEYDAAQERGEIAGQGGARGNQHSGNVPEQNVATAADIGLTRKDIHEARQIRDAEEAQPGVVRQTLDAKLAAGEEPTKAAVREAVIEAAKQGGRSATPNKNPSYEPPTRAGQAWTHLYGTCRALTEWANADNLLLARHGREERADDQAPNLNAIRSAADALNRFLEAVDAQ